MNVRLFKKHKDLLQLMVNAVEEGKKTNATKGRFSYIISIFAIALLIYSFLLLFAFRD